jgi:hypothetical protein
MPTANRRAFVPRAIEQFLQQDYANRELVIVDDGKDAIAELVPRDERVHYHRLDRRTVLGKKRNLAVEASLGEVLVNWDDDDWFAPWRISYQVEALVQARADVCGLDRLWFYDSTNARAFRYVFPPGSRRWVAGGTACFTRAFWSKHRFPEIAVGEDTRFVWSDPSAKILPLGNSDFYVASIHPANTSRKQVGDRRYQPVPVDEVRRLMSGAPAPSGAAAESAPASSPESPAAVPDDPPAAKPAASSLRVRLGIVVRDRPDFARASVDALRAGNVAADIVLLTNGVSAKTRASLPTAGVTEVVECPQARGAQDRFGGSLHQSLLERAGRVPGRGRGGCGPRAHGSLGDRAFRRRAGDARPPP